eukprot:jgi/Mesen1/1116/ME000123S00292
MSECLICKWKKRTPAAGSRSVAQMYPDEATLETYLKSREYGVPGGSGGGVPGGRGGGTAVPRLVKGAVVFHSEGPQKFDYSLRLNHTWAPSGFPDLSSIMDTTGGYTNDLQLGVNLVPTLQYGLSGFYSIQQVMDAYIIFYAQRHRVKPPAGTLEGEDEGGQEDGDGSGDEAFERGILDCPGFPGGYMDEDVTQAQSVWTGGEDLLPQGARGNASKGQLWRQFYDQEIRADEKMKEPADRQGRAGVGAAQKSSNGLYTMLPQSISVAPFPTPKYTDDHFQSIIKKVLGILYVVAFLFPETGIREGMRMMGLHNAAFHLAFFITYTVQFALSSAVITALAGGTLFKYSQKSVVFCFFLLFSESSIALCYLITPFFSRAKSAAAVGTLAFLGAYFPYYTVMDSQVSGVVRYLAALLSPTAFALGTINIADYERAHVGLRWSNVADASSGVNFLACMLMMLADCLLYIALGAYLDQVLPQEHGVQRPWHFLFTGGHRGAAPDSAAAGQAPKGCWRSRCERLLGCCCVPRLCSSPSSSSVALEQERELGEKLKGPGAGTGAGEGQVAALELDLEGGGGGLSLMDKPVSLSEAAAEGLGLEAVASDLQAQELFARCVQIKHLHKAYTGLAGERRVAVDDLNLTLYEGQILALLGHNGAGKSTTIAMLTGLTPPTGGDAVLLGHSIRSHMGTIRRTLGVCPQHNILFPELTVREHMALYAVLKGVPSHKLEAQIDRMIAEVGLAEKSHVATWALSGGMKRKLSVVILDEPTSGMDPYSMRATWRLLKRYKRGRVVLLTTHSMDEADVLGDRIAILGHGRLRCCGSAMYLKARYGVGYTLTAVKGDPAAQDMAALEETVLRHVPSATVLSHAGAEISFRLPLAATSSFQGLFRELDERKEGLPPRPPPDSHRTNLELRYAYAPQQAPERLSAAGPAPNDLGSEARPADRNDRAGIPGSNQGAAAGGAGAGGGGGGTFDDGTVGERAPGPADAPLGVSGYGVAVTTLEEVFLRVARDDDGAAVGSAARGPVGGVPTEDRSLQGAGRSRSRGSLAVGVGAGSGAGAGAGAEWGLGAGLGFGLGFKERPGEGSLSPDSSSVSVSGGGNSSDNLSAHSWAADGGGASQLASAKPPRAGREKTWAAGGAGGAQAAALLAGAGGVPGGGHLAALTSKKRVFWGHLTALLRKRALVGRRDKRALVFQLLVPVLFLLLGLLILVLKPHPDQPAVHLTTSRFNPAFLGHGAGGGPVPFNLTLPVSRQEEKPSAYRFPGGAQILSDAVAVAGPKDGPALVRMSEYLLGSTNESYASRYGAVVFGETKSDGSLAYTVLHNSTCQHGGPTFVNLVNDAILKAAGNSSNMTLHTRNHPLPLTTSQRAQRNDINAFSAAIIMNVAWSFIPASFAITIVKEREVKAKHQQLVSGVSVLAYWVSNYVWDCITYILPVALAMALFFCFNIQEFIGAETLVPTTLIVVGYGPAVAGLTYCLTFFFTDHSIAQNVVLLVHFFTGLILMVTSFIMGLITATQDINRHLKNVYRLSPGFCLADGLASLALRRQSLGSMSASSAHPFSWDVAGGSITFLYCEVVVYFGLVLLGEYVPSVGLVLQRLRHLHWPWAARPLREKVHLPPPPSPGRGALTPRASLDRVSSDLATEPLLLPGATPTDDDEDEDVAAERVRVAGPEGRSSLIRLLNLRKVYGGGGMRPAKVAVQSLSFGIPAGECFGFLGVNGAGKTSTLSMLSDGTAYIVGNDIRTNQDAARRLVGYCPQFDALLDLLTCREHLELYARIKGVPARQVDEVVAHKIAELDLTHFADSLAGTLSGGNKRKLSVAIAMVGDPPIVFLDEPSTGMDPVARRFMWDEITRISLRQGRCALMLTTHSMAEAQALCTRIGIMVAGRLRCLGSPQHLKNRFGAALELEVKAVTPSVREVERLCEALHAAIPSLLRQYPGPPLPGNATGQPPKEPAEQQRDYSSDSDSSSITPLPPWALATGGGGGGSGAMLRRQPHDHRVPGGCQTVVPAEAVVGAAHALGDEERAHALLAASESSSQACKDGEAQLGEAVAEQLQRDGWVLARAFCEWWLAYERAVRIGAFVRSSFPGALLLERNGSIFRYQLPLVGGASLADIFGHMEQHRAQVGIAEYSMGQTTLEAIFNSFAARQNE